MSEFEKKLPEGMLALERDPSLPDLNFADAYPLDKDPLIEAIDNSLKYLGRKSSKQYFPYHNITHDRAVASLARFKKILVESQSPSEFDRRIRKEFSLYRSRGADGRGKVLFTGYYTPVFQASPTRTAKFRYPLYRLPPDLVKTKDGRTLGRRVGKTLVPYYTREQIERDGPLRGQELAWLADRFEAYIVTIQGSAKLGLPGGKMLEIGYAGNNGHAYHSIGRDLIKEGRIPAHELSLKRLIRFFRENPDALDEYLYRNKRYVFFTKQPGRPRGSIDVPVTPYASIATDKAIYPRACLAVLAARIPARSPEGRIVMKPSVFFALDQDTGGAIRAAGRCDIYMGIGDEAGYLAGRQLSIGTLGYIFLK
jgi:membrane-bound lytic murein transglycosylase A